MKKFFIYFFIILVNSIFSSFIIWAIEKYYPIPKFYQDIINVFTITIPYLLFYKFNGINIKVKMIDITNLVVNKRLIKKILIVTLTYGLFNTITKLNRNDFPTTVFQLTSIATIITFPIIEELIFRVYLFKYLNYKSKAIQLFVTSVFFAIYHLEFNPSRFFWIFCAGLFFGAIYYLTDNVTVTIIAHSLYNLSTNLGFAKYTDYEYFVYSMVVFLVWSTILIGVSYVVSKTKNISIFKQIGRVP